MRYCPQCGIANEDSRQQCLRCQADLPAQAAVKPAIVVEASRLPGSHDYPPPSLHDPYAPVRLVAPPAVEVDDEFWTSFPGVPAAGSTSSPTP